MESIDNIFPQNFDFLEEILLEILYKLPAKSIFRFKCVSKKWFSLISDPSFLPNYIISHSKNEYIPPFTLIFQSDNYKGMHCFIFNDDHTSKNTHSFPILSDQISNLKRVEATSDDLILFRSKGYESLHYFLANPFIKKQCVTQLPMHGGRKIHGFPGFVAVFKNGRVCYYVVRIIKQQSDENEVSSINGNHSLNLEVFSSDIKEWRVFKIKNCSSTLEFDMRPCIVFKGILHWICNNMKTLFCYDPSSNLDQIRIISVPNEVKFMNGMNAIMGVTQENIWYFEMSRISIFDSTLPAWKLWVLKDYENGEWSLNQTAKDRKIEESLDVLSIILSDYSPLIPIAFHAWNKDTVYFLYEGCVLSFNAKKGWFDDEIFRFFSESVVSKWEIFPLLMPFCSTQIQDSQWNVNVEEVKGVTQI